MLKFKIIMKKIMYFAALAAMIVSLAACNNKVDYGKKTNAQIPAAKYTSSAQKIVPASGDFSEIEFTDGGYYVLTQKLSKASEPVQYFYGPYSVQGLTYVLEGFGKVTLGEVGNSITIEIDGRAPVSTTYTVKPASFDDEFFQNIAHAWVVDKVDLSVTYNNRNIGFVEDGSDLEKIAEHFLKQAEELGVEISQEDFDVSTLDGLEITRIIFSSSNSFIICFKNGYAYKGDLDAIDSDWDDDDYGYGFDYEFDLEDEANDLIPTTGKCVFTPKSSTTAWLEVTVKHGDNFTGRVIFYMTVADNNK